MPSLNNANLRLHRAEEHLAELAQVANSVLEAQAAATKVTVPPGGMIKPGEMGTMFFVESGKTPIPERLSVLVGDVANDLRSCLDYLVAELSELDSGKRGRRTQFPIESTSEGFKGRKRTFLEGVSEEHVQYIESLQPYNEVAWTQALARLSNWDKHTGLVVVTHDYLVGGTIEVGEVTPAGDRQMKSNFEITPALHIQLPDGLNLEESLKSARAGVKAVLEHFAPAFASGVG